ncbi:MAG: sigma-70 family RNA polymerase sigma factor [Gemmatimonadetes bacterium]|nr:sigma-70 family RNA polymerase sigma factor [Gemmatimonadota bacterium]
MDRADLERELERLHADSYTWALACCRRDRDAAEEALQLAYLKVLDGKARFDGRSSLKTWLFGVIRRTAAEERRRYWLRRRRFRNDAHPAVADPGPSPDAQIAEAERRARLLAAMRVLPRRQREVLELVFYHDLTIAEAAAVMAVSLGAARRHYERGKARLRRELGSEDRP